MQRAKAAAMILFAALVVGHAAPSEAEPVDVGSRLELFVDEHLIDRKEGVTLHLHRPQPRETAVLCDQPWEQRAPGPSSVVYDGELYRLYYRGMPADEPHNYVCYAESRDGKAWTKPDLGLWPYKGSTENNIVWRHRPGAHNLSVFLDRHPDPAIVEPQEDRGPQHGPRPERWDGNYPPPLRPDPQIIGRFKAIGGVVPFGVHVLKSDDGIRWTYAHPRQQPIINAYDLDSQNTMFYDSVRGEYRVYFRHRPDGRRRDIMTATSPHLLDFSQSEPVFLEYDGAQEQDLYTNAVTPYERAPHIFIGFPMRITQGRQPTDDPRDGVTDSLFMSSRDGQRFRLWGEAIIRPGAVERRWRSRTNSVATGLVETESDIPGAPGELSIYVTENTPDGGSLRRYVYRTDGFVSLRAPLDGGEVVTRPLIFEGDRLVLNVSTSAAGSVRVEIQSQEGEPLPGFSLDDSHEIYGDDIERAVQWRRGGDLGELAGTPIRLRFVLRDADLFALRFRGSDFARKLLTFP